MKHITYTCDKCKTERKVQEGEIGPMNVVYGYDLCDKCATELHEKIKAWISDEESTTKRIDDGKIAALRRAGWTIKAIAEEIGCSQPTIIKHLKDMGVEKGDEA